MVSVNKITLIGYLGADPEIKSIGENARVAILSVATSESWKDKDGEWHDNTQWHRIVVRNEHLIKIAEKKLHKGSKVYVEGPVEYRKYEKDGATHSVTEVVLRPYRGELYSMDAPEPKQPQPQTAKAVRPEPA